MEFRYDGLEQLPNAARFVIDHASDYKIWLLDGDMGAGKTTLIKAIGKELGIVDNITSPTFSLVNEYQDDKGISYFHFDFYRIEDEWEAMDIGTEEYFMSGRLCFVEWPSKIPSLIPDKYLKININLVSEFSREIILTTYDRPS